MRGLPQKQNARRADKIRLCGHLRRYKKIVKKTYIIYCNYDTQNVVAITLDDLQVGDEIILTIRNSEIENLQKEDDNKTKIAVEQLQLGTQRIK